MACRLARQPAYSSLLRLLRAYSSLSAQVFGLPVVVAVAGLLAAAEEVVGEAAADRPAPAWACGWGWFGPVCRRHGRR